MGFALGSLAVMSGFPSLEQSSLYGLSVLFELRSLLLALVVSFVLLVLAYLTNPSETSFRAFLTEQAFRHHLSRLDDADAQDELESASSARPDVLSKRGPSISSKHRANNAYVSPPFAFASRASVSLRTPKHIFRSFGILSIAAVVPSSPSNRSSGNRSQRIDDVATREDKDGGSSAYASLISDSWFIGAFGMWFWAANLDAFWRDVGLAAKDEVEGTVSGVLEIKALDRSDETNRSSSYTSNGNLNNRGPRSSPKLRSREQFAHQNGHTHNHRSQTPPPLPKSASLPLHTKRGSQPLTPEKFHHHGTHLNGSAFSVSSTSSPLVQPTPETRPINSITLPVPASSSPTPSSSPSRSPSSLFASSPLIAEIFRQITVSQSALADFRTQLSDFNSVSTSARALLDDELEKQRARKRADDAAKAELKAQTKALEDQKRAAEGARRDAEKRLKVARAERDSATARTDHLVREMHDLHAQMEAQGAAIVRSGVEAGALATDFVEQVEAKRAEIRGVEEEVTQLGARVREMEEKVAIEEQRLERAYADAEDRKRKQKQKHIQGQEEQIFALNGNAGNANAGAWHALPQLQTRQAEIKQLERTDVFPPSPITVSMPDSPLAIAPPEARVRHMSSPPLPIPTPNTSAAKGLSFFDADLNSRDPLRRNSHSHTFAPFSDLAPPGPLSPTSESLIPSSLYESLGMGATTSSPVTPAGMDVSRSFQSEDDIILDRDWFSRRNHSAGDVGQPLAFPSRASAGTGADISPVSPAGSVREFDPFEKRASPVRERLSSLRMDTQRAAFHVRPFVSDFAVAQAVVDDASSAATETAQAVPSTMARRSGWFMSSKDKDGKRREKKGLNPDAKEFSLSKDKERTFSAFLSRSRGSGSTSGSGTSSTPSTASLSTPDSASLINSPASVCASVSTVSPQAPAKAHVHAPARAASTLLSLGSAWFGSSRAFAPTPFEREQLGLARMLGDGTNASLDRLPGLPPAPAATSPQPKPMLTHAHSVGVLPRAWDSGLGMGMGLELPKMKSSSSFCPFANDEPIPGTSSSPTDESAGSGAVFAGRDAAGTADAHDQPKRSMHLV